MDIRDIMKRRMQGEIQFLESPGSDRTIMISSYIWWMDLMAFSAVELGYNVLLAEPWAVFFRDDDRWSNFDKAFDVWIKLLHRHRVQLVIGGDNGAVVPHRKTRELLHRAAGVPVVHYWWDEPRVDPSMMQRGYSRQDYLNALADDMTLNVFWDLDIKQEMETYHGLSNGIHLPLGTKPDFYGLPQHVPMHQRPLEGCFVGNWYGIADDWEAVQNPTLLRIATRLVEIRSNAGEVDRPMVDCVSDLCREDPDARAVFFPSQQDDCKASFHIWRVYEALQNQRLRADVVKAMSERLGDRFVLIGKRWERSGLSAAKESVIGPDAGVIYSATKLSLNLFGGCVHSGMPVRPFDIAASNGLIFTQYNRELPDLYEPGKECVAFRDFGEMNAALDEVLANPKAFNRMVRAGHRRTLKEHTWKHRLDTLFREAADRFDLPWSNLQ